MIDWIKIIVIITTTIMTIMATPVEEGVELVYVVVGGRAKLPCRTNPKMPHDQPTIVLWYLASEDKPIYSYDAREVNFTSGVRWHDGGVIGERAEFYPMATSSLLVLDPVLASDQGPYTCRVDYRISPPTVSSVNLTVFIPPGAPVIVWKDRKVVGTVGPIRKNERIDFICRSIGGRPPPEITWWVGEKKLPAMTSHSVSDYVTGSFSASARLTVTGSRELQGAVLTCRVKVPAGGHLMNSPFLRTITASVTLNVTLPPIEVQILGAETVAVTSGSRINLVCQTYGSYPPAQLTWWNERTSLETFYTQKILEGGNLTTSQLTMTVRQDDDDSALSCKAVNPSVPEHVLTDAVRLVVYYSPVVSVSLGRALDPRSIKEGDDVYFECNVKANPRQHRIQWYHNDVELSQNRSAGIVMSGSSLVLPGLQRKHSGSFRCSAANIHGNRTSSAVYLTVRHSPVCVEEDSERFQGAVQGSATRISCQVRAEPPDDIRWMWMRMKADGMEEEIDPGLIQSSGLSSNIQVTPVKQEDYGRILCRATNEVGSQRVPCVVNLMPAGPPENPTNCSAFLQMKDSSELGNVEEAVGVGKENVHKSKENEGQPSIIVRCLEGFDGGLQQYFLLEAWLDGRLLANMSSKVPEWLLSGIQMGSNVSLTIAAHNAYGHSKALALEVHTDSVQQQAATESEGVTDWMNLLGIVCGVVMVLVCVFALCIVTVKKRPQRPLKLENILNQPSGCTDGFDPDVVQSIQRQPPGLDVLPCRQDQGRETDGTLLFSESVVHKPQNYSGTGALDDQQYGQLYDEAEVNPNQSRKTNSTQVSDKKTQNMRGIQDHHSSSKMNNSSPTEFESDSEIRDIMFEKNDSKSIEIHGCEESIMNLSVEIRLPSNLSTIADQLTEHSTFSGDSGIHSLSSTKTCSLFSGSDGKSVILASTELPSQSRNSGRKSFSSQISSDHQISPLSEFSTYPESREMSDLPTSAELLFDPKTPGKHNFSPQYSSDHQIIPISQGLTFTEAEEKTRSLVSREPVYQSRTTGRYPFSHQTFREHKISSLSRGFGSGIPPSILQAEITPPSSTNQCSLLYSNDLQNINTEIFHQREATDLQFMNSCPSISNRESEREIKYERSKVHGTGRPATLLKGDHEDILLFSQTLPKNYSRRSRRNSESGFSTDREFGPLPTLYSSSSEIYSVGNTHSAFRDVIEGIHLDRSNTLSSDNQGYVRQQMVNTKVIKKDTGDKGSKFSFHFNYPERESSV